MSAGRLTPAAEEALHLAEYEARGGGRTYVGGGHLLFGLAAGRGGDADALLAALLEEHEGVAFVLLEQLTGQDTVRAELARLGASRRSDA